MAALTALGGAVTVEVTESVFADERAVAVLEGLAASGVPCAIDDFGTGYSCLASLKDLPVTTVKIDRSFIKDIAADDRDFAVVEAILALANALGLDVIAEGMETAATAIRLRDAGVVRAQGFWFARPMPARELDTWLASPLRGPLRRAGAHPGPRSPGGDRRGRRSAGDARRDSHVTVFFYDDDELLRELTTYVSEGLSGLGLDRDRDGHAQSGAACRAAAAPAGAGRARGTLPGLGRRADPGSVHARRLPGPGLFEQSVGSVVRTHLTENSVL